jgi:hypothetical protein
MAKVALRLIWRMYLRETSIGGTLLAVYAGARRRPDGGLRGCPRDSPDRNARGPA